MTLTVAAITTFLLLATAAHANRRSDTARNLNHGLAGTPMANTGYALEAAGFRYHISPYLIAGIAGTESSFGAASCRGNPYNAFGLSSCTTGWHVPYFPTWASAYTFMAKFLTGRWPNASNAWSYRGYAACSDCWAARVAYHIRARFGVTSAVRYP